jgi:hypothetical protein
VPYEFYRYLTNSHNNVPSTGRAILLPRCPRKATAHRNGISRIASRPNVHRPAGEPATFAEWSDLPEAKVRRREAAGDVVTRVAINPHLYAAWCRANGLAFGTETLISYAIAEARRRATRS